MLDAYFIIGVELVGGLAVIAGLGTRLFGALFAATMAVAFAIVHGSQGFFLPNGYAFHVDPLRGVDHAGGPGRGRVRYRNILSWKAMG